MTDQDRVAPTGTGLSQVRLGPTVAVFESVGRLSRAARSTVIIAVLDIAVDNIPIVDGDRYVGIVTTSDVLRLDQVLDDPNDEPCP